MCVKKKKSNKVDAKQQTPCTGSYTPTHSGGAGSYSASFKVDDPVQGHVGDCYLISALASIAWTNPARLSANGTYPNYSFLGTLVTAVNLTNYENMNVLLDAQNSPAGAHLGIYNNNWPLLYEKAYAIAKGSPMWGTTKCPDVSKIATGVGITTLKEVYKATSNNSFTINGKTETAAAIVTKLNACSSAGNNGKAFRPAVAWTTAAITEITSGHTYSYLGYYKDTSNNYYLVLRNPCRSEPNTANVATSGAWFVNFADRTDGIFALKFSAITNNLNIGYVA